MKMISRLEAMLVEYSAALDEAHRLSVNARLELMGAESDIERRNLVQQRGDAIRAIQWQLSKKMAQDLADLKVALVKDIDPLLNL